MAHSHAEHPTLTCPQCGAAFAPEIWLIIDAAERPELLTRARNGSLHTFSCIHGHVIEVDAPLILFRHDETPRLIYSPAERSTVQQDREIAAALVGKLRDSLGSEWQEEWLADFPPVPRDLLPALLSGDAAVLQAAMAAAVPPRVVRVLDEIEAEMAAAGQPFNTPEDLERALDERPDLQARLEAALREEDEEPPTPRRAPPVA